MTDFWISAAGCFVLGIMATLHPCPLSSLVAALSFLTGITGSSWQKKMALAGFVMAYTLVLVVVAMAVLYSLMAIPHLSIVLQRDFSGFLGPVFILAGMVLAGLLDTGSLYKDIIVRFTRFTSATFWSGILLGAMIALAFCPGTAAMFFGVMIPLALSQENGFLMPLIYALGAVLPAVTLSVLINQIQILTLNRAWIKRLPGIAGWVLIGVGIYNSLIFLF